METFDSNNKDAHSYFSEQVLFSVAKMPETHNNIF